MITRASIAVCFLALFGVGISCSVKPGIDVPETPPSGSSPGVTVHVVGLSSFSQMDQISREDFFTWIRAARIAAARQGHDDFDGIATTRGIDRYAVDLVDPWTEAAVDYALELCDRRGHLDELDSLDELEADEKHLVMKRFLRDIEENQQSLEALVATAVGGNRIEAEIDAHNFNTEFDAAGQLKDWLEVYLEGEDADAILLIEEALLGQRDHTSSLTPPEPVASIAASYVVPSVLGPPDGQDNRAVRRKQFRQRVI